MKLMFITNDPEAAREAVNAGIDRIFIDLEINGKYERQGHLDTHIAKHEIEDISKVKSKINEGEILVRVNPIFDGTKSEVDRSIENGADVIMLPMFKTKKEVQRFVEIVDGRAKVCLLLETAEAFVRVNQILEVDGIDEIHIGLNDLHLSLNLDFMFELLSEGIIDYLSKLIKDKNIQFGFGGIARIGQGNIPPEMILGEHYRLKSEMVILSREFGNRNYNELVSSLDICKEVKKIREVESEIKKWSQEIFLENKKEIQEKIRYVAERNRTAKK